MSGRNSKQRRKFYRPSAQREVRRVFILSTEGACTEPNYFRSLSSSSASVKIVCIKKGNSSDPKNVLRNLRAHLKVYSLYKDDEAWVVMDRDSWPEPELNVIAEWAQQKPQFGFALSNPCFELWLLLHYEDGTALPTAKACIGKLRKHISHFQKSLDYKIKFSPIMIRDAIQRAELRDNPPCEGWPRQCGNTTVYRLVKRILQEPSSNES